MAKLNGLSASVVALGCVFLSTILFCEQDVRATPSGTFQSEYIRPIPESLNLNPAKVALGKKLFNDTLLSGDNTASCATCHPLQNGGEDGKLHPVSSQIKDGMINTPTIFNCAFNFRFDWNGDHRTLEQQIEAEILHPYRMNITWETLLARLKTDNGYANSFETINQDGITKGAVIDAISAFTKSLITPDSRFDKYLRGDDNALTAEELQGYETFINFGCATCHQGINVGGNMYHRLGVFSNYYAGQDNPAPADLGRFSVTGNEEDRYMFRVPSLRNVALTAPYLHNGSIATLAETIRIKANIQLGRTIPEEDIKRIITFLNTLTGQYQGHTLSKAEKAQ
jgi:cytochrome c peroxidase